MSVNKENDDDDSLGVIYRRTAYIVRQESEDVKQKALTD